MRSIVKKFILNLLKDMDLFNQNYQETTLEGKLVLKYINSTTLPFFDQFVFYFTIRT